MLRLLVLILFLSGICVSCTDAQPYYSNNCNNRCLPPVQQINCGNCVCPPNPPNIKCCCAEQPPTVNSGCVNCVPIPPQEKKVIEPVIHQPEQQAEEILPEQGCCQETVVTKSCCQQQPKPAPSFVPIQQYPIFNNPVQNFPSQNYPQPCCWNSQINPGCVPCYPFPTYPQMQKPIRPPIMCNPLCFGNIQCCSPWRNGHRK